MFAYDNVGQLLYKSTDAGVNWTTTNIGTTLEGNTVVAMAISPNFATDGVLVAATASKVFRSQNGGVSFGEVSTSLLTTASGADGVDVSITSIDIAQYYTGGELAILVGTADSDADQGGGVFLCRLDTWTWSDQQVGDVAAGTGAAAGAGDVYAVAFSPNHLVDGQILAVVVGTTGAGDYAADTLYLATKFAANTWGADVLDCAVPGTSVGTITEANMAAANGYATIAFPSDYEWSSNNRVFVGTSSGSATLDDLYVVSGALPGSVSTSRDLNLSGTGTENDVYSVAVSGTYVGGTVIVGLQDSTTVKRTSDPSLSSVTWSSSVKSPIGDPTNPDTNVFMAGDKVLAATDGTNSCLSVSVDGGIHFNGLALIDVSATASLRYPDVSVVDANTMFLVIHDDDNDDDLFTAAETQHVFKTTDGGTTWQRVMFHSSTGTEGIFVVQASPEYATDSTVYAAQTDSRVWKSTNGGDRFIGLAAPAAITAFTAVDGSTYFTGHSTAIYKSGHWNSGTITGNAKSIEVIDEDTVVVGNDDGDVYLSTNASATSGVLYTIQGVDDELGNTNDVTVTAHPDYADNSTIFAGTEGGILYRWVVGSSTSWTELDDGATNADTLICYGLVVSPDGTLYAASRTANEGIRREVNPTYATALLGFESMTTLLPTGGRMQTLDYLAGSNVLIGIVDNATATTSYPHGWQLLTFTDTFSITPTIVSPVSGDQVSTTAELTWEAITAPSGTSVTYTYEVSLDSAYANDFVSPTTTTGTTVVVTGLTAGRHYYWRVYVAAGNPLTTRRATSDFIVKLGTATQSATLAAPAPGATDVSLKPNLQWTPIAGASSYVVELADNADFTDSTTAELTTTVWAFPDTLRYDTTYYWRVKAKSADTEGAWSTGIFTTVARAEPTVAPPAPAPTVTVEPPPAPQVTVEAPPPAPAPNVTVQVPEQEPTVPPTPAYIWVIIGIGAVLVIAVIVLIVRTRRVA
jgi:hypothetical protein